MNWWQKVYYFFSQYTAPAERRVGRFFGTVNENYRSDKIAASLRNLLQTDAAVINLWTERRYKGYNYLTKRVRRRLYDNLEQIKADFLIFEAQYDGQLTAVRERIRSIGASPSELTDQDDKLRHMAAIMSYLTPQNGRYQYRASSSFGRLLVDPAKETMIGDCNQIVTLYIVLYALKHPVSDLKLTLFPGHVALHFFGVDVEATNGTFRLYDETDQITVPIHEIVSVNLLDTTDSNYAKAEVSAEIFLQSARLAYLVSSNRQLVERNLSVTYVNVVAQLMKQQKYHLALSYAKQSKQFDLIERAAYNGALFALQQNDFRLARQLAASSQKRTKLDRQIDRTEAAKAFNGGQLETALKLYQRLNDSEMTKRCYQAMYGREQKRLGSLKTVDDIKANASVIRNMERYAKLSGDSHLIQGMQSLTKHL